MYSKLINNPFKTIFRFFRAEMNFARNIHYSVLNLNNLRQTNTYNWLIVRPQFYIWEIVYEFSELTIYLYFREGNYEYTLTVTNMLQQVPCHGGRQTKQYRHV